MTLWLLERIGHISYEEYEGFVVRADSETQARQIAAMQDLQFEHPAYAECTEIKPEGFPGIILTAFNSG